jgi:spermidine synthase
VESDSPGPAERASGALSPLVAAGLVFFTSAAVLVLEILAVRLLAPYVGMTLETYAAIIGVILAGIAVGTWLGGRAADRHDPRALLGPLLVAGGVLAMLVAPVVALLGEGLHGGGPEAIVIFATLGFFAPAAVLSAIAPTVVKLQLRDLRATGSVVGRLSAVGTAGAIAGTFATGFVLLAAFPSRTIVLALAALLVVGGLACWLAIGHRRWSGSLIVGLVLALAVVGLAGAMPGRCDFESAYHCVEMVPDPNRPEGRSLLLDGLRNSYVDLGDPAHLEMRYTRAFAAVIDAHFAPAEPIAALHVGGAAMTMPRYLAATRPGSFSRVLELDAQLVDIVEAELGLLDGRLLDVRTGDARTGIADEQAGGYDLVIGDAFSGLAVPWHLTTAEFVAEVRRVLRPDGLYVMNVIDHPPLDFARAQLATLRQVFPAVAVVGNAGPVSGLGGGNIILVGAGSPVPIAELQAQLARRDAGPVVIASAQLLDTLLAGAPVLVDDYAPVDQLLSRPR